MEPRLRWMIARDMDQVLDMEDLTYGGDAAKWGAREYRNLLRRQSFAGLVVEMGKGSIAGVVIYEAMRGKLKVHRVLVHPEMRELGCGTMMLNRVRQKIDRRRPVAYCEVPDDRLEFQLLLKSCGWVATKVNECWYTFELTLSRLVELELDIEKETIGV